MFRKTAKTLHSVASCSNSTRPNEVAVLSADLRDDWLQHWNMEIKNLSQNYSTAPKTGYTNANVNILCSRVPFWYGVLNLDASPSLLFTVASWNVLLSVSAIVLNTLVFAAVRRNHSLRLPSKILLLNLILTDFATGVFTQPFYAAFLLARATTSVHVTCILFRLYTFFLTMLSSASISAMTLISLDRYAAFFHHHKYKEIVTTKRVSVSLAITWSTSSLLTSQHYWASNEFLYFAACSLMFCLFAITTAYTKIYRGLRRYHGPRVHDQATAAGSALDVAKYRRTAYSMMWVCGLFMLCHLPHLCSLLVVIVRPAYAILLMFTPTVILLNSSLNPLLYCFSLPEIRADVIRSVRKLLPNAPQG